MRIAHYIIDNKCFIQSSLEYTHDLKKKKNIESIWALGFGVYPMQTPLCAITPLTSNFCLYLFRFGVEPWMRVMYNLPGRTNINRTETSVLWLLSSCKIISPSKMGFTPVLHLASHLNAPLREVQHYITLLINTQYSLPPTNILYGTFEVINIC